MALGRSELIALGSIAKKGLHGPFINMFKESYLNLSNTERKQNILSRIEVSVIIDALGLTKVVSDACIANLSEFEKGNEKDALIKMRKMIISELIPKNSSIDLFGSIDSDANEDQSFYIEESELEDEVPAEPPSIAERICDDEGREEIEKDFESLSAPVTATKSAFALKGLMSIHN
ncbi:MAG: hypothetical protein ACJAS1_005732 [Oleiphilaceae bacterium]|jgi:hypothetical protein